MVDKNCWETPDELFDHYNGWHNFDLDAAANGDNHKLPIWFGPDSSIGVYDALSVNWRDYGARIWLNPPYGRGLLEPFLIKANKEWLQGGIQVTMLLPVDTSTGWWHRRLAEHNRYGAVEFLQGRIKFKGATGSPRFASCVVHLG